ITNVEQKNCSAKAIGQLYGLRWRIETVFKSWKSHLKLNDTIHFNLKCAHKARIMIYSCLILSTLVQMGIYGHY
ncbi:MAG: transposase, partial [Bacteroidota bacterium]